MRTIKMSFLSFLLMILLLMSTTAVHAFATEDPCFDLGTTIGKSGDTVRIELKLRNNPGITAFSVSIGYSSKDLELIDIENGGLFDDAVSVGKLNVNPVTVSWYAADSENKTDNGTAAVLVFKIRDNASDSSVTLTYNPENVFDNRLQNKEFSVSDGFVYIGKKPTDYLLGDASGDGIIEVTDGTFLQRDIALIETPYTKAELLRGDADQNGKIEIFDVTAIQYYLANMKTQFPIGTRIE